MLVSLVGSSPEHGEISNEHDEEKTGWCTVYISLQDFLSLNVLIKIYCCLSDFSYIILTCFFWVAMVAMVVQITMLLQVAMVVQVATVVKVPTVVISHMELHHRVPQSQILNPRWTDAHHSLPPSRCLLFYVFELVQWFEKLRPVTIVQLGAISCSV